MLVWLFYETTNRWRLGLISLFDEQIFAPSLWQRNCGTICIVEREHKPAAIYLIKCQLGKEIDCVPLFCQVALQLVWMPHPSWELASSPWRQSPAQRLGCRCGRTAAGGGRPALPRLWRCRRAAGEPPPAKRLHSVEQRQCFYKQNIFLFHQLESIKWVISNKTINFIFLSTLVFFFFFPGGNSEKHSLSII